MAEIAVMCLNIKGEDMPTMQQVEVKPEGLQGVVNTIRSDQIAQRHAVQLNYPSTEGIVGDADIDECKDPKAYPCYGIIAYTEKAHIQD
ncbi:hypothetical protein E2562_018136 [Oryza meyeriana var. granulata]|uniref:Uncharacterized protein n=1 Tax=Oryza meyeriana var. granulata TaxID=110450 RepID=A0A6G1C742_9ORYZ|nr:hypothetical protein E2562_018136 [Oryza meyeriana var. granulata]